MREELEFRFESDLHTISRINIYKHPRYFRMEFFGSFYAEQWMYSGIDDIHTALYKAFSGLESALSNLIKKSVKERLFIINDLKHLEHFGSEGVNWLAFLHREFKKESHKSQAASGLKFICLINVSQRIRKILGLLGFQYGFPIIPTDDPNAFLHSYEKGLLNYEPSLSNYDLTIIVPRIEQLIQGIKRTPKTMRNITAREFEEVIFGLFIRNGCEAQLTKETRDGGRDIIAMMKIPGLELESKILIECKHPRKNHPIGVGLIRSLYGVLRHENAAKAILATSTYFSPEAHQFAGSHLSELELKAYADIMKWITAY